MSGPGDWWVDINRPMYVTAKKLINGKLYDVKLINDFPYAVPVQEAAPARPGQSASFQPTTPAPPPQPAPPPDDVKVPADTSSILGDLLLPGLVLAGAGAYLLAKGAGAGGCDGLICGSKCCPAGSSWYLASTGKCYSGWGDYYWAHYLEADLCATPVMTSKLKK